MQQTQPPERLLQYLWQHRLWSVCDMHTIDGLQIDVIDPGLLNQGSGPDFFNAKIAIDGHLWAGNVEIHIRASDWNRHHHSLDPAYDNVILHVVGESDTTITLRDGRTLPQMELPYSPDFRQRYIDLVHNDSPLHCISELPAIHSIYVTDWVTALGFERLYDKSDAILARNERLGGDWQLTAYVTLARALGFHTNSDPMERLAYAAPLRPMLRHRSDPMLVEALLMGQAGFLQQASVDNDDDRDYLTRLREHYRFLLTKYDIKPAPALNWKLGRLRPPNSPVRRIAALISMISDGFTFGRQFVHIRDEADARRLLDIQLRGYWVNHYAYGRKSAHAPRALSADSVSSLIINVVAPMLHAYGRQYVTDYRCDIAVSLLESLPAEHNSVVSTFTDAGIRCDDAFTSQALIQLRRNYCEPHKCLYCRLGHRILTHHARP